MFDSLKRGIKAEKWQGTQKIIKVEATLEPAEFEALFGRVGTLLQPTPDNNPTSTVTIRRFTSEEIQQFFGDQYKEDQLKGHEWSIGGIFQGKSKKLSLVSVDPFSAEVKYSKGTMKATVKFDCSGGGVSSYGWSYDDDF